MGGEPWLYIVNYQNNILNAMEELKMREFMAGRYYPAIRGLKFLPADDANNPTPGAQHASIEEAIDASFESGTRSILDMEGISDIPGNSIVTRLSNEKLANLYGTSRPTRDLVINKSAYNFFGDIKRGQGIYIILYKDEKPDEILFAGYSYD